MKFILDFLHFLQFIINFIWTLLLHLGRGTCILFYAAYQICANIINGLIIFCEEFRIFIFELNVIISDIYARIVNSGNDAVGGVFDGVSAFTNGLQRLQPNTTLIGKIFGSIFDLLLRSLLLIADTSWWLITLIPRMVVKLIVATGDFCVFSLYAAQAGLVYMVKAIIDDIVRVTMALFIIFVVWKKRYRILGYLHFIKRAIRQIARIVISRWRLRPNMRLQLPSNPNRRRSSPRERSPSYDTNLGDHQRCVVCRSRAKCIVLWPCRHLCLCEECLDQMKEINYQIMRCPLCRTDVETAMLVYL